MSEDNDEYGQHTRDSFHLADAIINGIEKPKMRSNLGRFINALFGLNEIAPNKAEYGMYAAHAVSLRSSDLSRQVGAAILSDKGDMLTQGCNEVPKAFGGTYWDEEEPDFRDVKIGKDSNDILKIDVLTDLVERLKRGGLLSEKVIRYGSASRIVNFLIGRNDAPDELESIRGSLRNSKVMDLTEYGRVVHAEMNAICDASRTGTALAGSHLYSTTFPCHNCTKHILAAGIREVVFLEPYPKSKAKELHNNEIEIEGDATGKVSFRSFIGITPRRYPDIFNKRKRKKDGKAVRWQFGGPAPMLDVITPDYLRLEEMVCLRDKSGAMEQNANSAEDVNMHATE
jgi:deoxycytidylate deaminase